jgi:phospholipid/cholesterol/gamma-HCH transport system permease protein
MSATASARADDSASPLARGFARIAHGATGAIANVGDVTLFAVRSLARVRYRPVRGALFFYQMLQIGVRSLWMALTMAAFAGMVLAYQFGYGLQRFGAKLYIGQTTITGLFRELGPILTALVVGGRIAAGIAAELGGMAVTEQIDAVRSLGADPLQRLVLPRVVAVVVALPLLTVLADLVGFVGAMVVASVEYGVGGHLFLSGVYDFVTIADFLTGLLKSAVYALIIGIFACHAGMRAHGGTEGVGRATTRAVLSSALGVLAADVVLTRLLINT